jgi:hypothetical protein
MKRRGGAKSRDMKGKPEDIYAEIGAFLIGKSIDRTIFFGPVAWVPGDGAAAKRWRFVVVSGDGRETQHDEMGAEDREMTVAMRAGIMAALVDRRPCVMIDFDDELELAKASEAQWPCVKITRLRQDIERERKPS